jgi:hypothetical protein
MASPHVAGALALLASTNNPSNATDVNNLYNQVKNAGNFNWTDDSGDGIKEPLLDISNTTLFSPVLIAGGGGDPEPTPEPTPDPGVSLSVTAYKVKGIRHADLAWTGATSTNVDIYFNSGLLGTTGNDGAHTHNLASKGGGSATYKVCEAGTLTCSAEVTVTW